MNTFTQKSRESRSRAITSGYAQKESNAQPTPVLINQRPEALAQRALSESLNQNPKVQSQLQLQQMFDQSPRVAAQMKLAATLSGRDSDLLPQQPVQRQNALEDEEMFQRQASLEEEEPLQGKLEPLQRETMLEEEEEPLQSKAELTQRRETLEEEEEPLQTLLEPAQRQAIDEEEEPLQGKSMALQKEEIVEDEEPLQAKSEPMQKGENRTGLPDELKAGVENLSGLSMDDVHVHYNSSAPATVQALAYTQGTEIHVGPGQEQHLAHEAWHVAQQKQGRVKPTMQAKGVAINNDRLLEREADVMGARADQGIVGVPTQLHSHNPPTNSTTVQMLWGSEYLPAIGSMLWRAGSYAAATAAAHPILTTLLVGGAGLYAWNSYQQRNKQNSLKGPQEGQVGLESLPEDQRWRLFINPKDFKKAIAAYERGEIPSPGDYYGYFDETDQLREKPSTAYKKSMTEAMQNELMFSGGHLGSKVDYKEYARLHDIVTGNFTKGGERERDTRESMRRPSGVETATGFPINDWDESRSDIAADLQDETIEDMPLVHRWNEEEGRIEPNTKGITYFVNDEGMIRVNYTQQRGLEIVQKILDRYYDEVGKAETKKQKLTAIVKAIRAIHVTHPYRDANGRLNTQILLNKFLLEQGFSPTILPEEGLGIFGGVFSVKELRGAVMTGMETFKELAEDKGGEGKGKEKIY